MKFVLIWCMLLVLSYPWVCRGVGSRRALGRQKDDTDTGASSSTSSVTGIVFVYTMSEDVCGNNKGDRWESFPTYISHVLNQALWTQQQQAAPHGSLSNKTRIYFVSNYKECGVIEKKIIDVVRSFCSERLGLLDADAIAQVIEFVDTSEVISERTRLFLRRSTNIFMPTHGSLWVSAAARFFWLEDLMRARGFHELVHLEGDNLLYAPLGPLLPSLRLHYPNCVAAAPQDANRSSFIASFLWIASLEAMHHFTEYFLQIASGNETSSWNAYTSWLRPYACCRQGSGIGEDSSGKGLKPFKINEMTIMAHYARLYPERLRALPIVPTFNYYQNRYTANSSNWSPNAGISGSSLYVPEAQTASHTASPALPGSAMWEERNARPDAYGSLFDPASWGQYLGGTHAKRGSDKHFRDSSHIVGQAVAINNCVARMRCGNIPGLHLLRYPPPPPAAGKSEGKAGQEAVTMSDELKGNASHTPQCYQAPFVRCGSTTDSNGTLLTAWHPLIQLHVHSKRMEEFLSLSRPCEC